MIVYANKLQLDRSSDGLNAAKDAISTWLHQKTGVAVNVSRVASESDIRVGDQTIRAWETNGTVPGIPKAIALEFSHPDSAVNGREWVTEIGILDDGEGDDIVVTVLLKTRDFSSNVGSMPVNPTRPGIIRLLATRCPLSSHTIGGTTQYVTSADVEHVKADIENPLRRHCVVLISPGNFAADPVVNSDRIGSQLIGLANVYAIRTKFDTFAFTRTLGAGRSAFKGSVNVLFPSAGPSNYIPTRVFRAESIERIREEDYSFDQELLSVITDRFNLRESWAHLTPEAVHRWTLAERIAQLRDVAAKNSDNAELLSLYEQETATYDAQIVELRHQLEQLHDALSQKEAESAAIIDQNRWLKYQLDQRSADEDQIPSKLSIRRFEDLEEVLDVVQTEMRNELYLTNRAEKTMAASPYKDFGSAYNAFAILASEFHPRLVRGESLEKAVETLAKHGIEYAAHISEISAGKFPDYLATYKGRPADFNKHLKLGGSRSPERCFRIHFEWDSDEELIVVHHAGVHLSGRGSKS